MKFIRIILCNLLFLSITSLHGQQEDEFVNNISLTNKLLSVSKFLNNGKFHLNLEDGVDYNFYNLKSFENSGQFQFNNNLSINNTSSRNNESGEDRVPLESFKNNVGGRIISTKSENDFGYVVINAKNLNNKGQIIVTNSNSIILNGLNVDLSRGTLNIKSGRDFEAGLNEVGEPSHYGLLGYYQDKRNFGQVETDWGLYDVYWGAGQVSVSPGSGVYASGSDVGVSVVSPSYSVTELVSPKNLIYDNYNLFDKPMQVRYPIAHYGSYINWNIVGTSGFSRRVDREGPDFQPHVNFKRILEGEGDQVTERWFGQGIFVNNRNNSISITPKLSSNDGVYDLPIGPLDLFAVELKTSVTNRIEETNETCSIYLISELGNVYPQATVLSNVQPSVAKNTFIPSTLTITRNINKEFEEGVRFAGSVTDFPFRGTFGIGDTLNPTINWASYGMRFTNVLSRINYSTETIIDNNNEIDPTFKNEDIQAGSVVINADNLNLEAAKIRAEGNLKITANNLISSKNAILDCQNISLDIGSKEPLLVIEDLIADEVYRFGGALEVYEATWEDTYKLITLNDAGEPEETTIPFHYKTMYLDVMSSTTNKVLVQSLKLRGKDILIEDKIKLIGDLIFEGESITFNNEFIIDSGRSNKFKWDDNVAKGLISITNNVLLTIPGDVQMGNTGKYIRSYANKGTNSMENFQIYTENFENSGKLDIHGSLSLNAKFLNLNNSSAEIKENASIKSDYIKLRNTTNTFHGILNIESKKLITDGGRDSTNVLSIKNGLISSSKNNRGKLLGTEFRLNAGSYKSFDVKWNSSMDLGPTIMGFKDNQAIGLLSLTNSYLGVFNIKSDRKDGAIYVDKLHFAGFDDNKLKTNKLEHLNIDDNVKIYFSSSNLPEEKLNGLHDGKLIWVKEFAGRYGSMPLYLEKLNRTIQVNKAFRRSLIFDTDEDGIANGFDLSPFGDGRPIITQKNNTISWMSIPSSRYAVEITYDLVKWDKIELFDNNTESFGIINYKIPKIYLPNSDKNTTFFVRVSYLD